MTPSFRFAFSAPTLRIFQQQPGAPALLVGFLTESGLTSADPAMLALWEERRAHAIGDDDRQEWFRGAAERAGYVFQEAEDGGVPGASGWAGALGMMDLGGDEDEDDEGA